MSGVQSLSNKDKQPIQNLHVLSALIHVDRLGFYETILFHYIEKRQMFFAKNK